MQTEMPEIKEIPYIRTDGIAKKAHIIPVEFSLKGLSEEEIQVLGHLCKASDSLMPVYAKQNFGNVLEVFDALTDFEWEQDFGSPTHESIANYNTLFAVRNSPWNGADGEGTRFPIDRRMIRPNEKLGKHLDFLINCIKAPPGRNLYPVGITAEELKAVEKGLRENTAVEFDRYGKPALVLHEQRYWNDLIHTINSLNKAAANSTDESLKNYLLKKQEQFKSGSVGSMRESDFAWLQNGSTLDFIMGTGIETYLDKIKGVVGNAGSVVFRTNEEYHGFCKSLLGLLPELEARAPWKHKKEVEASNFPKLKFVDVATWVGYETFPGTVVAQSLPNDEEFKQKYGTVNVVYTNVMKAIDRSPSGNFLRDKLMLKGEISRYEDLMPSIKLYMVATHEVGHASGGMVINENPNQHFGKDYHIMEEARAELFSMWALPIYVEKGILTPDGEVAGYYAMTISMLDALKNNPTDHSGARNMMFNYLMEHEALVEREEEGMIKYAVNPEKMRAAVSSMLGILGDIRAEGDKEAFEQFLGKYLSNAKKEEMVARLKDAPLGRGFIFPELEHSKTQGFRNSLIYPATFREQSRSLH